MIALSAHKLRDYTMSVLRRGWAGEGELTIAGGVITVTGKYHTVDTQSDDPTDDLDTINGVPAGETLVIQAASNARTVVVKDVSTGAGSPNMILAGSADFSLDHGDDTISLISDGTNLYELSRSDNSP